ncbi:hypothetical protein Tco_0304024, partial [Tanacetum coccineum]
MSRILMKNGHVMIGHEHASHVVFRKQAEEFLDVLSKLLLLLMLCMDWLVDFFKVVLEHNIVARTSASYQFLLYRLEQVEEDLYDIYDHVIEIPLQRIEDIETGQRELESRSLIAGGERASLLEQVASLERSITRLRGTMMMERARADRFWRRVRFMESELRLIVELVNMTITRSGMTPEEIKELVNRRVEEALATYEVTCAANALEAESQSQNGIDSGNENGGNRNGGNGNPNENNRGARPVTRECTYQDFMKCQPLK